MRIIFICPSLEPRMSGVGDYVISLAKELSRRGHFCLCLAANDNEDTEISSLSGLLSIVRLSRSSSWSIRAKRIQQVINNEMPDWISLQYVPYGYNPKGIPLRFVYELSRINTNAKWHFMFHELWVGISKKSPIRHKLIGFIQKNLVKLMVAKLIPRAVHTTNQLYVYLLTTNNITVDLLPLFGNIPVDHSESKWIATQLEELGITPPNRHQWLVVGMFGSIYPDYPLENQILNLLKLSVTQNKELALIGIGCGPGTGNFWEKRVLAALPNRKVRHFGSQSSQRVSAFLSALDLALPTTPYEFLGKSSSVASMVLHDVTLDLSYKMPFSDYDFLNYSNTSLSEMFLSIECVCDQLIEKFHSASRIYHF